MLYYREMLNQKSGEENNMISDVIKNRLKSNNVSYFANDNISDYFFPEELKQLEVEIEGKFKSLMDSLIIDYENDHNTQDTSERMAKMFLNEIFRGRYHNAPKVTVFPNVKEIDELVITKCAVRSVCSHHFQNIIGDCFIGVLYNDTLIGLSKFHRIVNWFSRRPQIQEELCVQIADYIQEILNPKALGVIIRARHGCVECRGVEQDGEMITSIMRGQLREDKSLKQEFIELAKSNGF